MTDIQQKTYDAFLSYSRKDKDIMLKVKADLEAADLKVWTDEELEPGTDKWEREISKAIKQSFCLIVLLSSTSIDSEWVNRELAYAEEQSVPIIPCKIKPVDETPIRIVSRQRVDLIEEYDQHLPRLIEAVRDYSQKVSPPPAAPSSSSQTPTTPGTSPHGKPPEDVPPPPKPAISEEPDLRFNRILLALLTFLGIGGILCFTRDFSAQAIGTFIIPWIAFLGLLFIPGQNTRLDTFFDNRLRPHWVRIVLIVGCISLAILLVICLIPLLIPSAGVQIEIRQYTAAYDEPGGSSTSQIPPGEVVTVIEMTSDKVWFRLRTPSGREFWIQWLSTIGTILGDINSVPTVVLPTATPTPNMTETSTAQTSTAAFHQTQTAEAYFSATASSQTLTATIEQTICQIDRFSISPSADAYPVDTVLTLFGTGNCRAGVRASRFNIDGEGYGEDAGALEQTETWRVTEGAHTICFEITFGEWEAGKSECIEFSGFIPTATSTPTPSTPEARILRAGIPIYIGPGLRYTPLAALTQHEIVTLLGISEDERWYFILRTNGSAGWVQISQNNLREAGNLNDVPLRPAPTDTPTFTYTPSNTPTNTPSETPTDTPTFTYTPSPTNTPTFTSTPTPTDKPTNTPTFTYTPSDTPSPTPTPTATHITTNRAWTPTGMPFADIEMVFVPRGCFLMGENGAKGRQCVESFWIDKTEVTNQMFRGSGDTLPVVDISWVEADVYCTSLGKRLPTEIEWEYAARGPESWKWPWGNEDDWDGRANFESNQRMPTGSFPIGVSWVGALDMSGNVWEFTADPVSEEYHRIKGGSFSAFQSLSPADGGQNNDGADDIGLRCARDND